MALGHCDWHRGYAAGCFRCQAKQRSYKEATPRGRRTPTELDAGKYANGQAMPTGMRTEANWWRMKEIGQRYEAMTVLRRHRSDP